MARTDRPVELKHRPIFHLFRFTKRYLYCFANAVGFPIDEIGTTVLLRTYRSLQYFIHAVLLRQGSGSTYKSGNGVVGEGRDS